MFQYDCVAGHERRDHAVHGDEIRIVPGRDGQHDAERLTSYEAGEVLFRAGVDVGQRVRRNGDHVSRTLERAVHFVWRVTNRPTHLPGEFSSDGFTLAGEEIAEPAE